MVDGGKIYQMVTVAVRSPVPVAWITMGFELDDKAARELADITGLGVTLSLHSGFDADRCREHGSYGLGAAAGRRGAPHSFVRPRGYRGRGHACRVRSPRRARRSSGSPTMLFLIAGVSLIGFGWAAFGIARNITRPLRDLTRSVDRIRGGDYGISLTVQRRDELGVLAEGLKHMQTAVQSRDQSIRRLAYEDTLTGLMNRTAFSAALQVALTQADGGIVAVAMINLLRFRRINEHLGYSVGDEVLTAIARRLALHYQIRRWLG
jgi:methyl-accepting chemotaxis protein